MAAHKIPCVVLAWFDFESVKTTLDLLTRQADRLDLVVVENPSSETEQHFKPYLMRLLEAGLISKYILFDQNISNNAFEVVFDSGLIDYRACEYICLTDGDLQIHKEAWLDEEVAILSGHPEVFACGMRLDLDNLPLTTFPDASHWVPTAISHEQDFIEGLTGAQLVLVRANEFLEFLAYRRAARQRFLDSTMHQYCYNVMGRKWARTKLHTARHLTWDRYADLAHPYTRATKLARSHFATWFHHDYCGCWVFEPGRRTRYTPVKKIWWARYMRLRTAPRRIARWCVAKVLRRHRPTA